MIEGLSHITFITSDLDRMEEVLVSVIAARKVYDSGEATFSLSKERFFLAGPEDAAIWIAIMEGDPLATKTYNHVAFKIAAIDYERARARIVALGLEMREGRSRVTGEGESLYFYDHDNHLFELHTGTLEERLRRYAAGRAIA